MAHMVLLLEFRPKDQSNSTGLFSLVQANAEIFLDFLVPPRANGVDVLPSFKPKSANTVESIEAENENDEEWEMNLFERVRQDPSVPAHFKTTFGILVANNRNLREEKAFLQSRLGLV